VGGSAQTLDLVKRLEHAGHAGAGPVEYVREMRNVLEHDSARQLPADLRGQALKPPEPVIDRLRVAHDRHEDPTLAEVGRNPYLRDGHRDRLGSMAAAKDVADLALDKFVDSDDAVGHVCGPGGGPI